MNTEKTTAFRKAEVWIVIKSLVDGEVRNLELSDRIDAQGSDSTEGETVQKILEQLAKLEATPIQECSDPKGACADCSLHETSPSVKAVDKDEGTFILSSQEKLLWMALKELARGRIYLSEAEKHSIAHDTILNPSFGAYGVNARKSLEVITAKLKKVQEEGPDYPAPLGSLKR